VAANRKWRFRTRQQQGYALILVVFLTTMLLIGAMLVAPNIRTEGQREQEKEMIWRGSQYVRGIKLYYRKTGRPPTSIDDLVKPKIGSLRFLRQAYKDPMNKEDGSWRLIYVGPAGQLIGSLKPRQPNLQFGQPVNALAAPTAVSGLGNAGQTGQSPFGQFGQQGQSSTQQSGTQTGVSASGTNTPTLPPGTTGAPVSADQGTDAPIPSGDTPTIVGGNIIGVGSKIDKKSIKVYDHAKNYRLFEFIWDPSKDVTIVGQPGLQTPQQPPQNPQPQ